MLLETETGAASLELCKDVKVRTVSPKADHFPELGWEREGKDMVSNHMFLCNRE